VPGADLCEGCRAFLLEDSDVDPRRPWTSPPCVSLVQARRGSSRVTAEYHAAVSVDGQVFHMVSYGPPPDAAAAAELYDRVCRDMAAAIRQLAPRFLADITEAVHHAAGVMADLGIALDDEPPSPVEVARARNREVVAQHRRAHRRTNRLPPNPGRNR
jgi:hypothetical protein